MMKPITITLMLLAAGSACAAGTPPHDSPEAKWQRECGACHVAYPARFLTAGDWDRLMASLDRHFGDNATVDPATAKDIAGYLRRHSGTGSRHSSRTLRISDTPWFDRAHRELPRGAFTHPAVKSPANCTACHVDAGRGDWSEEGVLLPPGIRMEEEEENED